MCIVYAFESADFPAWFKTRCLLVPPIVLGRHQKYLPLQVPRNYSLVFCPWEVSEDGMQGSQQDCDALSGLTAGLTMWFTQIHCVTFWCTLDTLQDDAFSWCFNVICCNALWCTVMGCFEWAGWHCGQTVDHHQGQTKPQRRTNERQFKQTNKQQFCKQKTSYWTTNNSGQSLS